MHYLLFINKELYSAHKTQESAINEADLIVCLSDAEISHLRQHNQLQGKVQIKPCECNHPLRHVVSECAAIV